MAEENEKDQENQQSNEQEQPNDDSTEQSQGLTQEDVDKQVKEALAKQKQATAQAQKEAKAKHEQEIEEARKKGEERAKMTAQQKADDDAKERNARLDKREADLKARMDEIDRRDALSSTQSSLSEKGIPSKFAEFLSDVDSDKRSQNIDKFSGLWQKAVQDAIDEKLKGDHTPQTSSSHVEQDVSKNDWDKMSYSEQVKVYKEDPELAKKLNSKNMF